MAPALHECNVDQYRCVQGSFQTLLNSDPGRNQDDQLHQELLNPVLQVNLVDHHKNALWNSVLGKNLEDFHRHMQLETLSLEETKKTSAAKCCKILSLGKTHRTRSCGLTSTRRSGRAPPGSSSNDRSKSSGWGGGSPGSSPCSSARSLSPPRPWPSSGAVRRGAGTWPGPERSTAARYRHHERSRRCRRLIAAPLSRSTMSLPLGVRLEKSHIKERQPWVKRLCCHCCCCCAGVCDSVESLCVVIVIVVFVV